MREGLLVDWVRLHGGHFERSRVLVTGGAGFIGSHLVEALAALGASVVILDDMSAPCPGWKPPSHDVEVVEGSILDAAAVRRAMRGCRYAFHEAALISVPESLTEPGRYNEVNVVGTRVVLEGARETGLERVVFAGSASVYGDNPSLPHAEGMKPMPASPYAETKLAGEDLMRTFSVPGGLDAVTLRYFNVFGPRQSAGSPYSGVIATFADALSKGERPTIHGDGEQSRDFVFVPNVVHANLLAARRAETLQGKAINIGTGTRTTINQLARTMADLARRSALEPLRQPERAGDVRHSLADVSLARELLGFVPLVSLEDGLRVVLEEM